MMMTRTEKKGGLGVMKTHVVGGTIIGVWDSKESLDLRLLLYALSANNYGLYSI